MHDINFVISSLRGGGAERMAVHLCNGWAEQGLSVVLTTLSDSSDDDYTLSSSVQRVALNVESHSKHKFSGISANLMRIRALRKSIKQNVAHTYIGFSGTSNILLIVATAFMSANVVVAERNYPPKSMRGRLWTSLRRHLYRFADHVVVQTHSGADWIKNHTSAKNVCVIPNSVTWPVAQGVPEVMPESFFPNDRQLLLAVGNIQPQKGFDLLLQALANEQFLESNWLLAIAGAGDTEKLTKLIANYGLQNHVQVVGRVGNISQWFERADAFVLSSRYEGFPNVLLEAMAAGCPVVSFDCPTGPADIVSHETNGLLVNAENTELLGVELNRLMKDSELRASLGERAKDVITQYSSEKMFQRWAGVLVKKTESN